MSQRTQIMPPEPPRQVRWIFPAGGRRWTLERAWRRSRRAESGWVRDGWTLRDTVCGTSSRHWRMADAVNDAVCIAEHELFVRAWASSARDAGQQLKLVADAPTMGTVTVWLDRAGFGPRIFGHFPDDAQLETRVADLLKLLDIDLRFARGTLRP